MNGKKGSSGVSTVLAGIILAILMSASACEQQNRQGNKEAGAERTSESTEGTSGTQEDEPEPLPGC